ncbi:hypothetical protein DPMN_031671 [Dreissena polymorpha]|uniref:Uncharacterized protein n=1 Tax=Dreissena polymorpha TaxID=45954 RepID=A0A9D4M2R6_DREPO|nr:hypothetical protein DPMN_031671 [Dreissena polymorpha]
MLLVIDVFHPGQDVLCHDRLLASVPDAHITASSSNVANQPITSPARGRLNTTETTLSNGTIAMGAWAPAADQHGEYIQVWRCIEGITSDLVNDS